MIWIRQILQLLSTFAKLCCLCCSHSAVEDGGEVELGASLDFGKKKKKKSKKKDGEGAEGAGDEEDMNLDDDLNLVRRPHVLIQLQ